jgi:single-strand selective monofunctional uracil DNA glycosylase
LWRVPDTAHPSSCLRYISALGGLLDRARKLLLAGVRLCEALAPLRFGPPVTHVYNPLEYARASYEAYVMRYGQSRKRVLFLGMNPGPFGMTQTGVPFGEVSQVRDWLGIECAVGKPAREHPRRPVHGFACARSEVSGARLWGLWRALYQTPERFFAWGFVANYCPLVFMDATGRNLTPDKLGRAERTALLAPCDAHLRAVVRALEPEYVVGIGKFAELRARAALAESAVGRFAAPQVAWMPHPSPASPAANRDWEGAARAALAAQGVPLG